MVDRDRDRDRGPTRDNDSSNNNSSYHTLAPMSSSQHTSPPRPANNNNSSSTLSADRAAGNTPPDGKRSPNTSRSGGAASKISVKKEPPSSPSLHSSSRHRPRRLDLSASTLSSQSASTSRGPLTAREGGLTAMHDVGLACLSPGFQTHDPAMREQLQRSISVRDQQRSIIESRLQKTAKGDGPDGIKPSESNLFGSIKTPSSKKRPPPGLSIVPPSASQFANERVIQSAPLNQTFTGRHQPHPITRHLMNHPSDHMNSPSSSSHILHAPANQTNNRLPPIADVFGSDALVPRNQDRDHRDWDREGNNTRTNGFYQPPPVSQSLNNTNTNNASMAPLPSPGLPVNSSSSSSSNNQSYSSKRPREYRSAEEAVHELAGGREDLLPRIIHYNGNGSALNNNPNTTQAHPRHPSPLPSAGLPPNGTQQPNSLHHPPSTSRRRTRNEYERDNGSPPLGNGPDLRYRPAPAAPHGGSPSQHGHGNGAGASTGGYAYGPFGAGRDSPETQRRKKEEFLGLCARAWDLFHS
ncbi:hypothetical protein AJ79_07564 [Helicocarpus griseus UAMH5409]|uniref:Uncharacterized protein n=1 Tax=Helicocarpus griseus UAMH5409 TaxID=1447875 RepID=A0A2B7X181_9EURO|nr:hypothetical protein AJ79_07564 [Helicocarpus griseus UAMH5409]